MTIDSDKNIINEQENKKNVCNFSQIHAQERKQKSHY